MTTESKKLQTRIIEGMLASKAVLPGGHPVVATASEKAHDTHIAHEMLPVLRKLVGAVQADGCLPDGYCFCPENRDAHKAEHVGECRDLREALTAAAPFLEA